MKKVSSYYYYPIIFFLLLSLAQPNIENILMTIVSSIVLGLFAGVVLHLVVIVSKKIKQKG